MSSKISANPTRYFSQPPPGPAPKFGSRSAAYLGREVRVEIYSGNPRYNCPDLQISRYIDDVPAGRIFLPNDAGILRWLSATFKELAGS